jgi:hypothetical protein
MPTHRIRLGPPWEVTSAGDHTRHARKFGRPRILDANERVWVVCDLVPGPATLTVNGQQVAATDAGQPVAADITQLLNPRNELVIETASAGPLGEVALEVRPA